MAKDNKNMNNKKDDNTQYLPIGMCIGLAIGVGIGAALGNIPLYMCIGLSIGVGIGALIDSKNKEKSKDDTENEDK